LPGGLGSLMDENTAFTTWDSPPTFPSSLPPSLPADEALGGDRYHSHDVGHHVARVERPLL
jgi:hypothetical protein